MKIIIGIPSRGRPFDMIASVLSLYRCASGNNEIELLLAVDDDDQPSIGAGELLKTYSTDAFCITMQVSPRAPALGELHNRHVDATPADATYMMWSDRISVIAHAWDHELAIGCLQFPTRPMWLDSVHLAGAGQVILPPAWRAAQCGPCFPAMSPFWADDTHQEELDALVHGFPRVALSAKCAGPRIAKTNRCRDIPFWIDLLTATRPHRVEQARAIAGRLGVKFANPSAMIALFDARDAEMKLRAPGLMATFGEIGEPDASYIAAKDRAEAFMASLESPGLPQEAA